MHSLPLRCLSLLLVMLASCGPSTPSPSPESPAGTLSLTVTAHALGDPSGIRSIVATISADDLAPLSTELHEGREGWAGVLTGIPVGTDRVLRAEALDEHGTVRYKGEAKNLTIMAGAMTLVTLNLQDLERPQGEGGLEVGATFNTAPRVGYLETTQSRLDVGQSTELSVRTED
ncbi:hypothetical protein [Archangium primigenium]|uniref:hypothetical protein n=1 Tax=[Archangium] primigenium TaxID=2792470 RepID=UPI00195865A5|nr:hypothetical protein [Archangium primigenium]MBM7112025.1 hypothetical protein [Archangium primigenium]